jgi:hypothetical protein
MPRHPGFRCAASALRLLDSRDDGKRNFMVTLEGQW